jgi:hypothetical protein
MARILGNELLTQGANASSAALVAFIMLLLVGTQVMSWQWALAIPLAAAAFGLYRVNRGCRRLTPWRKLSTIGWRADTLSTAMFFSQVKPDAPVSSEIRQLQFERAGQLAQSVDAASRPYTMPRGVYLMGALVPVASSLFALRYGLSNAWISNNPSHHAAPFSGLRQAHRAGQERAAQSQTGFPKPRTKTARAPPSRMSRPPASRTPIRTFRPLTNRIRRAVPHPLQVRFQ